MIPRAFPILSFFLITLSLNAQPTSFPGAFRFQTLQVTGYPNFRPTAMNDNGDVVGNYRDPNNRSHGVIRSAGGAVTALDISGASDTTLTGINNSGQISGYYYPQGANGSRGFLRQANGTIVLRDVPGATNVQLNAINNLGRMVGSYDGHALIFEPDGSFNFFDAPVPARNFGSPASTAYGINDTGQIVGQWTRYDGAGATSRGCFFRDSDGTVSLPSFYSCDGLLSINNLGTEIVAGFYSTVYLHNLVDMRTYVFPPEIPGYDVGDLVAINNLNNIALVDTKGKAYTGTPCAASISPSSQTVPAAGGIVTVQVTTDAGCTWASNDDLAFAIGDGFPLSGTGSSTFTFHAQPYTTSTADRSAVVYLAGATFTITQSGAPCVATFGSGGTPYPAPGGTGSAQVTAPDGCSWTVTSNAPWLQITSGSGTGSGSFSFNVATNPSATVRTGSFSLPGGQSFFINQASATCAFAVIPDNTSFAATGGSGTVTVTTTAGCGWTYSSNASWITLPNATTGNGSGAAGFVVANNTGGNLRSGTLIVAGTVFTITQQGSPVSGLGFVPITPCRLMDTRITSGKTGDFGPPFLYAGNVRDVPVPSGGCNIPSTARAYSINTTVVPHKPLSFLTIYPAGQARPNVSTLNAFEGQIIANAAIVPAGGNGAISIFVTDDTEVILDINGYFTDPSAPGALVFYPLSPCRVIDTRTGSGGPQGDFGPPSLAGGQNRSFPIRSSGCNVPASAGAYVFNITVVPSSPLDYITAWPSGQARPLVSVQNSPTGRVLANAAIVPAGTNGDISLFAPQTTDAVVDINGYFAPAGQPGGLRFYPVDPCRLADTRAGSGFSLNQGPPILGPQTSRLFPVAGICNVTAAAKAFSLNLTVVPPSYLGFVTLYPGPQRPFVSTLNAWEGQVAANAAIVPGDPSGGVNVFVSNATQIVLDVNGYFAP